MDAIELTQMTDWIERCATRLQARTEADDRQGAVEWATAAWEEYGGSHCPERAAEALAVACSGGCAW
ncbi:hypothetical protein OOT46_13065 [Aquabacterium sp. A7-Y]|uniref:hypothetical protein n=1 Tax=Aquabacterium sp. A7-Y TaxID=1349605 RepID=UPI00223C9717|nr:hypothetical protein [Aquabacterium sp. A7-Y]MCW7538772.1 hypothetical protein [Aquabacterium sp. A7-Y]